ncbi:MAG: RNA methyltransferase [Verrucomicrobiales bacterium]|nr:RNA methyltransferase [Verrucomicrobiales bacterium]|tara:strand:+ start:2202 stop:3356 length:1155 start_codon:yes stop_codon:yes gene_type:complete
MTETEQNHRELKEGARFSVTIEDLAFGGDGVARIDEMVVFVPFTIPGERVEIELTKVKTAFARGRIVNVEEPSANRVEPACGHFADCGGCQYQHIDYPAQLNLKRKQITDIFQRIGGFVEPPIDSVVPCPQPLGYRNRIMVRSQREKQTGLMKLGFLSAESKRVVDLERCAIAEDEVNRQLAEARRSMPPKGGLKTVLRKMPADWEVGRDSFFQNNFFLLPKLVESVRECLKEANTRHLIDAYCGVGFFSIECADLVETFVGVELDAQAIKSARQNMASREIKNGQYAKGFAEDYLPGLLMRHPGEQTALIIDPPRTGCPPRSMERIRRAKPQQVIYVSCHPATLARDLKILCADGVYDLKRVVPHDMFPQTQHVECVADLRVR